MYSKVVTPFCITPVVKKKISKTKVRKLTFGALCNMQLQKKVIYKNSQAGKKSAAPKSQGEKQRWQSRNGCDDSSMAKILITIIQVNLCVLSTKFT